MGHSRGRSARKHRSWASGDLSVRTPRAASTAATRRLNISERLLSRSRVVIGTTAPGSDPVNSLVPGHTRDHHWNGLNDCKIAVASSGITQSHFGCTSALLLLTAEGIHPLALGKKILWQYYDGFYCLGLSPSIGSKFVIKPAVRPAWGELSINPQLSSPEVYCGNCPTESLSDFKIALFHCFLTVAKRDCPDSTAKWFPLPCEEALLN